VVDNRINVFVAASCWVELEDMFTRHCNGSFTSMSVGYLDVDMDSDMFE
jgi:hypothetical protein